MKNIFPLIVLFLATMFVFISTSKADTDANNDPCSTEQTEAKNAYAAYTKAAQKVHEVERRAIAFITATGMPLPPSPEDWRNVIDNRDLLNEYINAADTANRLYREFKAAQKKFFDCHKKHRCPGCLHRISEQGIQGHRPLLCAEDHQYYECNADDVTKHTSTDTCTTCTNTYLRCVADSHECPPAPTCERSGCTVELHTDEDRALHKQVNCAGCGIPYFLCDSGPEALHRVRTCNRGIWDYYRPILIGGRITYPLVGYCQQSYRNCTNFDMTLNQPCRSNTRIGISREHSETTGSP